MMAARPVVLVTGLSGAGRASILRHLEDLGFETVDNPPLDLLEELVGDGDQPLAAGVDTRSRGFDSDQVLLTLARLRLRPDICSAASARPGGATRWRPAARSAAASPTASPASRP
jgi:UPF0042 nucleotide-binding protein